MYYTVKEMKRALDKATEIINNRTKEKGFVRGYSDCFMFFVEYDKVLRGKESVAEGILDFEYSSPKEFLKGLLKKGYRFETCATICNYEIIKNLKPRLGDIGVKDGSAIIAGDGHWVTIDEENKGVVTSSRYYVFDRKLTLLSRPLRIQT
jgi:hypothetical protein